MGGHTETADSDFAEPSFDDYVLPFQLDSSGARGRLVRLGPVVDTILSQHPYPEQVLLLLGEAVTLTAMLGAALKFDGKFILQTQSDGPVSFLVVHYNSPGHVRGYASFNHDDVARASDGTGEGFKPLLGHGHLAMTIDQGAGMDRYQGIVALAGETLVDAAHEYFDQSEQIPTFIRIAVARHFQGRHNGKQGQWTWRAGGLMVQKLPSTGGNPREHQPAPEESAADDEGWRRAQALAATIEDHELLDPTLAPDRLLYRLFHEEDVRAFNATPLAARCNCSREKVEQMLARFSEDDINDMADGDVITVTCEFCNTHYRFKTSDTKGLRGGSNDGPNSSGGTA
jgi:molecular chaperone Hsp33